MTFGRKKKHSTYDVIEDVTLMQMDGDEGLIFGTVNFGKFQRRLVDEDVEKCEEVLVRGRHDFGVLAALFQRFRGVVRPDPLKAEQTHLGRIGVEEGDDGELWLQDDHVRPPDHLTQAVLGRLHQPVEPGLDWPFADDHGLQLSSEKRYRTRENCAHTNRGYMT
ncbi:unnamed protein product [Protopolystoma xenopodis]|uniref:Uncharacterized protein n=1 Tax=Protopolystoma xenopodis TaxID=117903 RepID=A0A448XF21_9PLAT|nr:unnamed protein product [Protopolystoma xenopodis]